MSANTYIKYAVTSIDNGQHVELCCYRPVIESSTFVF